MFLLVVSGISEQNISMKFGGDFCSVRNIYLSRSRSKYGSRRFENSQCREILIKTAFLNAEEQTAHIAGLYLPYEDAYDNVVLNPYLVVV